ncbi:hypothetical protein [Actinoplanes awajinensis]|uniref:Uncharacterized protein n=1 Tax=Actinoplanes awajinensis subsp. mycoplanecinus TaxID=135947 RepID=A0A101JN88_9ACTN|nr:hypothetical protein [Actinoplanes awajinensis]KUL29999.1 hypothetical protein ADL15_25850 [Actinoplanes awajinensis subsp. mycoplanecinus]
MTDLAGDRRTSKPGRAVVWVQVAFLIAYLTGSFVVLILAAARADDLGAILHPGLERLGDPKDSLPGVGPDSLVNPLVWIFAGCRLIAWLIYPIGIAMLLLGAATLAHTWRSGDRRTFLRLAVLTVIWLILIALAASPYGNDLLRWLLD